MPRKAPPADSPPLTLVGAGVAEADAIEVDHLPPNFGLDLRVDGFAVVAAHQKGTSRGRGDSGTKTHIAGYTAGEGKVYFRDPAGFAAFVVAADLPRLAGLPPAGALQGSDPRKQAIPADFFPSRR